MIILGMDPGTRVTGYGIIKSHSNRCEALDFGCIKPPIKLKLSDRCFIIFKGSKALIERYKPDALVVETQFVHANWQSSITLGIARGVILLAAKEYNVPVYEYAHTQAKRAVVGNGRASKAQVQHMVRHRLNLDSVPEPEDAADALALALCHEQAHKFKQLCGREV